MRPITRAALVGLALAALTLGLMLQAVCSSFVHTCEVCVTFQGRKACREASGRTPQEATRTALDNACSFVASGMTQSVQCTSRPPDSATCRED